MQLKTATGPEGLNVIPPPSEPFPTTTECENTVTSILESTYQGLPCLMACAENSTFPHAFAKAFHK